MDLHYGYIMLIKPPYLARFIPREPAGHSTSGSSALETFERAFILLMRELNWAHDCLSNRQHIKLKILTTAAATTSDLNIELKGVAMFLP